MMLTAAQECDGYLRANPVATRLYQESRHQLLGQAIVGTGQLIETLLASRRRKLHELCRSPRLKRVFDDLWKMIHDPSKPLNGGYRPLQRSDLVTVRGKVIPMPADDRILSVPTSAPAGDLLRTLRTLDPWRGQVAQILSDSSLQDAETPYRTDTVDGLPIIIGQNAPTIEALAGLSHELGHCIYERSFPRHAIGAQLMSEQVAHLMEERVVAEYLREHGSHEDYWRWLRYQRLIDALNLYFFELERSLLFGKAELEPLFEESATAFRESLFAVPGYQTAYAFASMSRLARKELE